MKTEILLERLKDEYSARMFYRNSFIMLSNKGFNKAAEFAKNEAKDELKHSAIIEQFLIDWGIPFEVPLPYAVSIPTSLKEFIEIAFGLEKSLYEKYSKNAIEEMSGDQSVYSLLLSFIEIQRKSVAEYKNLIDRMNLVNMNNNLNVFMFEAESFK